MANLKVGDQVMFLNEKGGGIITKIAADGIVYVAVSDGFEIPYAMGDLIRSGSGPMSDIHTGTNNQQPENPDLESLYYVSNKKDQLPQGIYLAFEPENQDQPLQGEIRIYLMNHTDFQLLFSIFLNKSGVYHGYEYGYVDSESRLFLTSLKRNEAEDWSNGLIQGLFFNEGKMKPVQPVSANIGFKPVSLFNHSSFQYEGLIRQKAMIVELTNLEKQAQNLLNDSITEEHIKLLQEKIHHGGRAAEQKKQAGTFLDKHKVDDQIAEVDLHIGELIADFSQLSNVQIIGIQMDYMKKCFDQAAIEKLKKIIFIHGIGNGTLKNEILRYLRQATDIDFYDASYARYGMGATEVLFYKH